MEVPNVDEDYVHLSSSTGFTYLLQLEHEKYYVGFTERRDGERFNEHFQGRGSLWTQKYRPLQVLEYRPGTLEDEDLRTLDAMKRYGWWNVRGGQWCRVDLTQPPTELRPQLKWYDRAVSAGSFLISEIWGQILNPARCQRCGRRNHRTDECWAQRHRDGTELTTRESFSPESHPSPNQMIRANKRCQRCGRLGHTVETGCWARTHRDGTLLGK